MRRGLLWKRILLCGVLGLLALAVLIQAVPYGRAHMNPPVRAEPAWNAPLTRDLAARACFDCHSNQVTWPWYSNIAPVSWLIQRDVDEGRSTLNFSEWKRPQEGTGDVVEAVLGKSMPPWYFTLLHSNAKLSKLEREQLARGLQSTIAKSPPPGRTGGG